MRNERHVASLISAFRCGTANEFRNRFAPYDGGTLNLFVEVGIQAAGSHLSGGSQIINDVAHPFEQVTHRNWCGGVRTGPGDEPADPSTSGLDAVSPARGYRLG